MTRRYELDESPHAGDLELIGMLPAELRRLVKAWKLLEFASGPQTAGSWSETRRMRYSGGQVMPDAAHAKLREFRETKRKAISRLADEIITRVREVKRCPTCKGENSWADKHCTHCGAALPGVPARTKGRDA